MALQARLGDLDRHHDVGFGFRGDDGGDLGLGVDAGRHVSHRPAGGARDCSAACAASSNCFSSDALAPRKPLAVLRAHSMYAILRPTDQSAAGLVTRVRKLLVLSASLRIFARADFLWAVSA